MAEFVLIGGGGHARVLRNVLRRLEHTVLGFYAPNPGEISLDVPYLGDDEVLLNTVDRDHMHLAFALGKVETQSYRLNVLETFIRAGFSAPPIVAPTATVHDDVALGEGSVVLDGAVVVTGSRLGRGCIVNTHATVDHDCLLSNDVHVAPGATLSGNVTIGSGCFIGANATVIHSITICDGVTVGAGATVVADITRPGVYLGTPARKAV